MRASGRMRGGRRRLTAHLLQRTWSTFNYIAYWVSDATNVAVWELASSMLAIGLSWYVKPGPHLSNSLHTC